MSVFRHVIIRIYLYFLLFLFFITGGLSMFLLAPVYKLSFAPNASWRDLHALGIWAHVYKIMWRSMSSKNYRDLYPSKLTDPPQYNNDPVMRIKESWNGAKDNCDICQNSCCAQIDCPMLDSNKRCVCYASLYFGYFFCGRYPSNQGQADLYDCPKWEVSPEK